MSRLRLSRPAAPSGLLLAACWGLGIGFGCPAAQAQTAVAPYADPFAPATLTGTKNPPRFETFNRKRPPTRTTGLPRTFQPLKPLAGPPPGAGTTGFDATNTGINPQTGQTTETPGTTGIASTTQYGTAPAAQYGTVAGTNALPGSSAPVVPPTLSPYQQPPPPLATSALAQAPGGPPVPEIGPIRRPFKKRSAHPDEPIDPYAPTGVRVGSFEVFPAVEIIGGYNTNPGSEPSGKAAWLYTIAPEVLLRSDWSRHSLNAELRGSYTGYTPDETPTLSRPYLNGKVDGRIDATRDTHIDLSGRLLVSTDNPGSPNLQAGLAKLPIYTTFGGSAGITHRFNRFELAVKGDAQRTAYQDSELTDGSTSSNKDRNYDQYGGTVRGTYELTPALKPFVEVGADTRIHDIEPDVYGYQRNSKGVTGKVGTTFELTGELTGEASIGYTHRSYDDPRFGGLDGLIGDASLIWTADALNTLNLTASSSVGESSVAGVSGVLYRSVGLQYDHSFRRWLIGSVKLGFGVDTYKGGSGDSSTSVICDCVITTPGETTPDRQDLRYSAGFGLTYKLSRELWLKGEFRQDWVRSNVTGVDYDASTFLLGARLQR